MKFWSIHTCRGLKGTLKYRCFLFIVPEVTELLWLTACSAIARTFSGMRTSDWVPAFIPVALFYVQKWSYCVALLDYLVFPLVISLKSSGEFFPAAFYHFDVAACVDKISQLSIIPLCEVISLSLFILGARKELYRPKRGILKFTCFSVDLEQ